MITGHNANVRHGGRVFHVQTEDSGRSHPHVITHLYCEGTILASERREYAEMVHAPDLVARVRRLMEEQHAAMIERLRRGEFDRAIAARVAAPAAGRAAAPAAPAEMATPAAPGAAPRPARAPAPAPPATAAPAAAPVAAAATPRPAAGAAPAPQPSRARAFGEGIVSERPLDDVILEYLVARSRDRAGGGRGSRSEG
jgi:hypothetical protein